MSTGKKSRHSHDEAGQFYEAKRKSVEEHVALLAERLKQGQSTDLLNYLAFAARLHQYSPNNQMLIQLQCPHARQVAGYRRWQELGVKGDKNGNKIPFQVADGEKAIYIMAPMTSRVKVDVSSDDTDTEEADASHEKGGKGVKVKRGGMGWARVFDISQLTPESQARVPDFWRPLGNDCGELVAGLVGVCEANGFRVEEMSLGLDGTQGFCGVDHIVTRAGLDSRNRFLTLLHELTHGLIHWREPVIERTRRDKEAARLRECHAEATAFIVALHFDIDSPLSAGYLANWSTTPEVLMAELQHVQKAARKIIDALESAISPQGDQQVKEAEATEA